MCDGCHVNCGKQTIEKLVENADVILACPAATNILRQMEQSQQNSVSSLFFDGKLVGDSVFRTAATTQRQYIIG